MRYLTAVVYSLLFAGLAWAQPSPVAEKKAEKETRYPRMDGEGRSRQQGEGRCSDEEAGRTSESQELRGSREDGGFHSEVDWRETVKPEQRRIGAAATSEEKLEKQ